MVLLSLLLAELHSLEEVRLVGGAQLVADVVSLDLSVPIFSLWRLPSYPQGVLVHGFHLHSCGRPTWSCKQRN